MDKTEKITFRVNEELKKRIEEYCAKEGIPVAQYIRKVVSKDLENKK